VGVLKLKEEKEIGEWKKKPEINSKQNPLKLNPGCFREHFG